MIEHHPFIRLGTEDALYIFCRLFPTQIPMVLFFFTGTVKNLKRRVRSDNSNRNLGRIVPASQSGRCGWVFAMGTAPVLGNYPLRNLVFALGV